MDVEDEYDELKRAGRGCLLAGAVFAAGLAVALAVLLYVIFRLSP